MSKNRKLVSIALALATVVILITQGCVKDTTVYIETKPAEITRPVSFSKDIIPIFSSSCSTTGCHSSGGHKPDLTKDKAYVSLRDGNYYNTKVPESSELYLWLTGKRSTSMPMGAPNNPSSINELVLAWIKQGAKNN
jgi:hypothetical protein